MSSVAPVMSATVVSKALDTTTSKSILRIQFVVTVYLLGGTAVSYLSCLNLDPFRSSSVVSEEAGLGCAKTRSRISAPPLALRRRSRYRASSIQNEIRM